MWAAVTICNDNANASVETLIEQAREKLNGIKALCINMNANTSEIRHTMANSLQDPQISKQNKKKLQDIIEYGCISVKELGSRIEAANNRNKSIIKTLSDLDNIITEVNKSNQLSAATYCSAEERNHDIINTLREQLAQTQNELKILLSERIQAEKSLEQFIINNTQESPALADVQNKLQTKQATANEVFLYNCLLNLAEKNEKLRSAGK